MKFKKALEKAKQERYLKELMPPDFETEAPPDPAESKWTPPVYSQSRSLHIGENTMHKKRSFCLLSNSSELEYFKVLRAQILHRTSEMGWNTIMITSIRSGEGKSMTAINLAMAFAKSYAQTALLIDCDLRKQSIHRYLGLASDKNIVDYLQNEEPLKNVMIWPNIDKLTLISGSNTTTEGAELLGSPRMKSLMTDVKNRYNDRYILIDTQPLFNGAETMTLAPLVDAIVIVIESGKTPAKQIQKALELIPKEKLLGFVLNKYTPSQNQ